MTLENVLEYLKRHPEVQVRLSAAIKKRGARGESIDEVLDAYSLRNMYREAVIFNRQAIAANGGVWIRDVNRLASIMRQMGVSIDELVDMSPFPFNDWVSGQRVLILLGTRTGLLNGKSGTHGHFDGVANQDDEARTFISNQLQKGMRCLIEVERFSAAMDYDEADDYIARLLDHPTRLRPRNLGAIVVIGAPPTNPMAEPFAQRILLGHPSPYQFRWADPYPMRRMTDKPIVLSHPKNCDYEEEGLAVPCCARNELFRRRANVDCARFKNSARDSYDCGLILMNRFYSADHPRLILLAGHGADATLAVTYALFHEDLPGHLVKHESLTDVEHALIRVTSSKRYVKPNGKHRGWDFHHDPLLDNDEDDPGEAA